MRARVKYNHPIEINKEDGTVVNLPMQGQTVEIIEIDGENSCKCRTIGFPWRGTFYFGKHNLEIIEDP